MVSDVLVKNQDKIRRAAYGAFAFLLPFSDWSSIKFSSILLITCIFLAVLALCTRTARSGSSWLRPFFILAALFLIQLVSWLQGGDMEMILSGWMIKLPFLLFPFILLVLGVDDADWLAIKRAFIAGCALSVLFSFRFLAEPDFNSSMLLQHHTYEKYFLLHRPYFGIYLLTALVFLQDKVFRPSFTLLLMVFFVLFLVLIQAKMALAIMLLLFAVQGFRYLKHTIWRRMILFFSAAGLCLVFFLFQFYISHKEHPDRLSSQARFFVLSVNTRMIHWDCAWDIFSSHVWIGAGEGHIRQEMNRCYESKYPDVFQFVKNFNVHNEWMEEAVRHGLAGLMVYGLCFIFFFRVALRGGDRTYLSFLIIVLLASLTETIFSRSQGVMMIAFFNAVMYLRNESQRGFTLSPDRIKAASASASVGSK